MAATPTPRYDRDGNPIGPGPAFGAVTRQTWETNEEREERLTSPDGDQVEEAIEGILLEVEQAKELYGVSDEEGISTLEELDELSAAQPTPPRSQRRRS
jgi:hypothetical protein